MEVTLDQLKAVDPKALRFNYLRRMLESAINYVEKKGGKAYIHAHVLEDLGVIK